VLNNLTDNCAIQMNRCKTSRKKIDFFFIDSQIKLLDHSSSPTLLLVVGNTEKKFDKKNLRWTNKKPKTLITLKKRIFEEAQSISSIKAQQHISIFRFRETDMYQTYVFHFLLLYILDAILTAAQIARDLSQLIASLTSRNTFARPTEINQSSICTVLEKVCVLLLQY
jgi:hypothetical protein